MDGGSWHCTGGSDQDSQEKEMQKGKKLSEEALQTAEKRNWKRLDKYMCITESLHCMLETNTTL